MGEAFGKYELIDKIGEGGMAEVFRARLRGIGGFEKIVVIKRLLGRLADNDDVVRMFVSEARLCSILSHPHIVQIHDLGVEQGMYYFVMEHVRGRDLLRVLQVAARDEVSVGGDLAAYIASCVAHALSYAHDVEDGHGHALRIVHRDVSPANILVSGAGDVKLTDFGVARVDTDHADIARAAPDRPAGELASLRGKLSYMAPEQVAGTPIDHRADIFALGIVLWETVTLKRLFLGRTPGQTAQNVVEVRVDKRFQRHDYVPTRLMEIIRRALARDPDRRYQRASDMADDLLDFLFERRARVTGDRLAELMGSLFPELATAPISTRRTGRPSAMPRDTVETPTVSPADLAAEADHDTIETHEAATDAEPSDGGSSARVPPGGVGGLGYERLDALLDVEHASAGPWPVDASGRPRALGGVPIGLDDLETSARFVYGGELLRAWLPRVLLRSRARAATGVLCLTHDWVRKDVFVERGAVRHVRTNRQDELLAIFLVSRGELSPAAIETSLAHARANDLRLGEALIELGHTDPEALSAALLDNQRARLREPLSWARGHFAFYEGVAMPPYGLAVGFDLAPELGPGLRAGIDELTLRSLFEPLRAHRVLPRTPPPPDLAVAGLGLGKTACVAATRILELRPRVRAILDGKGDTAAALRGLLVLLAADLAETRAE